MKTVYYLCGPTVSGKTSLAVELAKQIPNAIFINADTMQLYRTFGTMTGLPTTEELSRMDHRLFGVLDASEDCSRNQWFNMALLEIKRAFKAGKCPILVGGSRSFLAVLAEAAFKFKMPVDQNNAITFVEDTRKPRKFPYQLAPIFLIPPEEAVTSRIETEIAPRALATIDEIRTLIVSQNDFSKPAFWAFGFRELKQVVEGTLSFQDAVQQIITRNINYAKEQYRLFNDFYEQCSRNNNCIGTIRINTTDKPKRVEQALGFIQKIQNTTKILFAGCQPRKNAKVNLGRDNALIA